MSNQNLNQNAKEDINTLNEKSKIDEQINEKQSELEEFKYQKQKRDFLKKTLELMADYLYSIEFWICRHQRRNIDSNILRRRNKNNIKQYKILLFLTLRTI